MVLKKKMREQGNTLPICGETFELHEPRISEEKWVAKQMSEGGNEIGSLALPGLVLSTITTQLGIFKFDQEDSGRVKLSEYKKIQEALKSLSHNDVMYMYVYLLWKVDEELEFKHKCTKCRNEYPVAFDLGEVDVSVLEDPSEMEVEVQLKRGFSFKGEDVTRVTLGPVDYRYMIPLTNLLEQKEEVLRRAIKKVNGKACGVIGDVTMNEMYSRDKKILQEAIGDTDTVRGGIELDIHFTCPHCHEKQASVFDPLELFHFF